MFIKYFKDDHKRIIRVVIYDSGEVLLHVSHMTNREKVWVPLPKAQTREVMAVDTGLEQSSFNELVEEAHNCPLFAKD